MILKLDRARGRGIVRSHSGKEIAFEFPFVAVVGARIGGTMPGIDLIREGDIVGFDVGWTSRGTAHHDHPSAQRRELISACAGTSATS